MIQGTVRMPRALSKTRALRNLGPVVYALRLDDDIIKIGYTTDLVDRERTVRRQGNSTTSELLAVMLGTYNDEQALHARLEPFRAHGIEYYHPTPEVLAVVNEMRASIGMTALAG